MQVLVLFFKTVVSPETRLTNHNTYLQTVRLNILVKNLYYPVTFVPFVCYTPHDC